MPVRHEDCSGIQPVTSSPKKDEPAPVNKHAGPDIDENGETGAGESYDPSDEARRRAQELIEELHDRNPEKSKTIRGSS